MFIQTLLILALHCPDLSNRVYLATYPRSGNHWMRYLIEEATHVATGSVYAECGKRPFSWGAYAFKGGYEGHCTFPQSGDTFVVKTHYPVDDDKRRFDALPYKMTLRIVRQPVPSIYSYYLFVTKEPKDIVPHEWVVKAVESWKHFQLYWNTKPNVVTLLYENLFDHPEEELKTALLAVGLKVTDADIRRAVAKHPPKTGVADHASHFTAEDLAYIERELQDLVQQFYPLSKSRVDPLS